MEIYEKPEISHLRVFADGCRYEQKDQYLCIMTIHHLGDSEKFISGLKGVMNKKIYTMIRDHLISNGAIFLRYEKVKPDGNVKLRRLNAFQKN